MLIDSHVHISTLKKGKSFALVKKELLFNMEKNGIDFSIVISDNYKNDQCADLDTALKLIEGEPRLFLIGALKAEDVNVSNLVKIENLFRNGQIRGFKIFPGHDPVYPTDPRWPAIYKLCIKYDFPLIVHTGINTNDTDCAKYNNPKLIVEVAKKNPKLKIIISHYYWPELDYCFETTKDVPNIYFDTSALADPEVTSASGGIEKVKQILEKTMKRDQSSLIFGTDWPMCDVKKHIDLINSLEITHEDKEAIFHKNSVKIFKIKEPSGDGSHSSF